MAEDNNCVQDIDIIQLDENKNSSSKWDKIPQSNEGVELSPSTKCIVDINCVPLCQNSNENIISFESPEKVADNLEKSADTAFNLSSQSIIDTCNNSFSSKCELLNIDNNTSQNAENVKLIDFTDTNLNEFNNSLGTVFSNISSDQDNTNFKEEDFHDAVQFFKDPSSFNFLENVGTSEKCDPSIPRSSLYVKFDPLLSNSSNQMLNKPSGLPDINESVPEQDSLHEDLEEKKLSSVNKPVDTLSLRESLGNILISFDSPMKISKAEKQEIPGTSQPPKLYTEEDFQKAVKICELQFQEMYLKRQKELDEKITKKTEEMDLKFEKLSKLCTAFHQVLSTFSDLTLSLSEKHKELCGNFAKKEIENENLKEELKTSAEDLQSVETTFSDFHKRYEQCKSMLKTYKDNEEHLKQELENMQIKLEKQEEKCMLLQKQMQEIEEKANVEVAQAKKCSEAQIVVLQAQLKKAELKISSLESDCKQRESESSKLRSICDDLIAKVGET
ncbi:transforming acidic coiled-coil-containing protein 3-like [Stegodyphus dumicola]|uniref:transforming acidic coiled-coil-containing protein 3-like n=1 Tax=Stegodyphus dumicola TaxID=202533 RepID=UPI0015AE8100|nr:transforming acidic coiled-coil-containing protein 3-like [Stegodyphus dumicola]